MAQQRRAESWGEQDCQAGCLEDLPELAVLDEGCDVDNAGADDEEAVVEMERVADDEVAGESDTDDCECPFHRSPPWVHLRWFGVARQG